MTKKKQHVPNPITKTEKINYLISKVNNDILRLPGLDEYCVGLIHQSTGKTVLCYDLKAILIDGKTKGNNIGDMLKICDLTDKNKIPSCKTPMFLEFI